MKKYLSLILIVIAFLGCEKKEQTNHKKTMIKSVFVVTPIQKYSDITRVFNATASSNHQIKLSFKVKGNIDYLKCELGDEVKKGTLIAKLDAKPYELQVSQMKFALSEAKAGLQNTKSSYERTKKLYINQNASASDIDKNRALFDSAKAKVENIEKQLEFAKLQLSYTKLYAPMNGYISFKYMQKSENVNAGTPIVLISDQVVDEVRVQVPEVIINKIKKDDRVKVLFNSFDKNREFMAKVSEISKFASQNSKTYTVVVKLENSSKRIKSGMSADVVFNLEVKDKKDIFCLPSNSVLNDKNGYFVYVVKDNKIKIKPVKTGRLTANGYEILAGLTIKDLVLKAGMSEVFENMKVQIANIKELEN